jgi:hypothetical protein
MPKDDSLVPPKSKPKPVELGKRKGEPRYLKAEAEARSSEG